MAYHSGSTLETASRFLAGNIEAELIPTAFSSLLLSLFLLSLLFPLFFFLFFTTRHDLLFSSFALALGLRPPARLPCAATRNGGGRLTWYLSDSLGCGGG